MTKRIMSLADDVCDGRLVVVHEGGYSEVYVPFCAHAVLQQMCGSAKHAADPFADTLAKRQPTDRFTNWVNAGLDEMAQDLR